MATIRKEITATAKPDQVWAAIQDIGALHTRLVPGFVVSSNPAPELYPSPMESRFANGSPTRIRRRCKSGRSEPAGRCPPISRPRTTGIPSTSPTSTALAAEAMRRGASAKLLVAVAGIVIMHGPFFILVFGLVIALYAAVVAFRTYVMVRGAKSLELIRVTPKEIDALIGKLGSLPAAGQMSGGGASSGGYGGGGSAFLVVLLLALLVAWLIYIATPRAPAKTLNSSF